MSRIVLAFSSFFRLLFGAKLHERAADYLPESARPALPAPEHAVKRDAPEERPRVREVEPVEDKDADERARAAADEKREEARIKAQKARTTTQAEHHRDGALALLALLQREGRLLDFLREDLSEYDDEDIGASVRDIHRGCKKVIDEHLELEPVMPGEEDEEVVVPRGFDPGEIRLMGEVSGEPPFKGVMRHHGWRVTKTKLPTLTEGVDRHVLAPAEVEIS